MTTPVVLVHHRAPEWCLSSAAALAASASLSPALFVVDNSGEFVRGFGGLPEGTRVVATPSNLGYAGGANFGIRLALEAYPTADAVVVCAHDFHPERPALSLLRDALVEHPDVGIAGPQLTAPDPSAGWTWNGRRAVNLTEVGRDDDVVEVDWVSGTCMMLRRECLQQIGGFDEGFGSYVEDLDLCLRARDAGWRVVCVPTAKGRGIGSASAARARLVAVNVALLVAKREGAAAAWGVAATYAWRAIRGHLIALVALWRPAVRRQASRRRAHATTQAVWQLVTTRRIRNYARSPTQRVPPVA